MFSGDGEVGSGGTVAELFLRAWMEDNENVRRKDAGLEGAAGGGSRELAVVAVDCRRREDA